MSLGITVQAWEGRCTFGGAYKRYDVLFCTSTAIGWQPLAYRMS